MCYNVPSGRSELSTREGLDLLDQMAEAGVLYLTLSGGEILSRPDFFQLAQRAQTLGFALYLKTNATLINEERASRIRALSPMQVDVSLLGARAATFDRITRTKGSLSRVMRGIHYLIDAGVRVKLNTLLLDLNFEEREEMAALARRLEIDHELFCQVSPADDGSDRAGVHQLGDDALIQLESACGAEGGGLEGADGRSCQVSLSSCLVAPDGIVYPCLEMRIPAGDLRQAPFARIWRESPLLNRLREHHTVANLHECRRCPLREYCSSRCAGLAYKESGDLLAGNLLACRRAQARFRLSHPEESVPETPLQTRMLNPSHGGRLGEENITLESREKARIEIGFMP